MMEAGFQRALAEYAAPTLCGSKCGSLLCISDRTCSVTENVVEFNRAFKTLGLRIRLMCRCRDRVRLYVYRPGELEKRLALPEVQSLLADFGYSSGMDAGKCLSRLSMRIACEDGFPHEIGVFLGYPARDVAGFIENGGRNFKLCGLWKVYGDTLDALRLFDEYAKCREYLCNRLGEGCDLYTALLPESMEVS